LSLKNVDRICLTLVVLSIIVSGYLLLTKGLEKRRALIVDRMRIERTSEDIGQVDINLGRLRTFIRADQEELGKLNRETFGNGEIGEFVKRLDASARQRGIILVSIQPQKASPEGLFQRIPVQMTCRGSFAGLYQFLLDLETGDRLAVVSKLLMGRTEKSGTCQLDLTAFLFTGGRALEQPPVKP
jgi:Tfp pilus assembly protein PilO